MLFVQSVLPYLHMWHPHQVETDSPLLQAVPVRLFSSDSSFHPDPSNTSRRGSPWNWEGNKMEAGLRFTVIVFVEFWSMWSVCFRVCVCWASAEDLMMMLTPVLEGLKSDLHLQLHLHPVVFILFSSTCLSLSICLSVCQSSTELWRRTGLSPEQSLLTFWCWSR